MNSKVVSIFLVISFAFCAHCLPFKKELCDWKNLDKLIPDPKNCRRFFECTQEGWQSMPCPSTLYFNPATSVCDYPANVKCATEVQLNLSFNNEPCDWKDLDKLIPDPKNCGRFFECSQEGWQSMPCPSTLYFNPVTSLCDYPANVKCATEVQLNLSFNNEPCDWKDLDKLIPDPKNCGRFFECSQEGWQSMPCPSTLYFNPATSLCDYPQNVKCASEVQLNLSVNNEPCDWNDLDKLIPDPKDCGRFFECSQEGWQSMPCPSTLYFNPAISVCDYPENVQCNATINTR